MSQDSFQAPDADVQQRPGHQKEHDPRPVPRAHWLEPQRQSDTGLEILHDPSRTGLTATFGTEHQPSGLSGVLRRKAYQVPDYRVSRWLLLIIADRVAALEAEFSPRKPRNALLLAAGVVATAGYFYFRRPRNGLIGFLAGGRAARSS